MCGIAPGKPSKSEQDYRAEDDFRTLQRAEEVRMDKSRHGRALQHGAKQMTGMQRIMGRLPKAGRILKRVPSRR